VLPLAVAPQRGWADAAPPVGYTISIARAADHVVDVKLNLPAGASERELQLPVWNSLYQVRDFAQYVAWVKARNHAGQAVAVRKLDKSRWGISGAENGAEVEYEIFANQPGPYDAQLNQHHAFFNLAEILMYPVDARSSPAQVEFTNVPHGWRTATSLMATGTGFSAKNYDELVDSPVEMGDFEESDFDADGGHYRVVVDAERSDYDMQKIVGMVRRIVLAGTQWMNDRPFETYLFLYHFPRENSFGGMEHAYSTAIDLNAQAVKEDSQRLADVTAHEFFHLWNVKRIRPQTLEPVDYTKENFTRALWFSEGVTSTVQEYVLLRAGLLDEAKFLDRLADQIGVLERRPAHLTQSAEESSLDAWLEKYSYYHLPERSISYYNKGQLLGVLLDLQLRDASYGSAGLREMMQWMNRNYAQKGRFFADSAGVQQAAQAIGHLDLTSFFEKYVAGTEEIPWDDFFKGVGLRLAKHSLAVPDLGFFANRSFGTPPTVIRVAPNSEAEHAGLAADDVLIEINGKSAGADFETQLGVLQARDMLHLKVRNNQGQRDLAWKVKSREEIEYELKDVEGITPQQRAHRAAWIKNEPEGDRYK